MSSLPSPIYQTVDQDIQSPADPVGAYITSTGRRQSSPWGNEPPRTPLHPLDIEAANRTLNDSKTWTGYQSNDSFTAVESRTNSVVSYGPGYESRKSSVWNEDEGDDRTKGHRTRDLRASVASGKFKMIEINMENDNKAYPIPKRLPPPAAAPPPPPPLSRTRQVALIIICCLAQFLNLASMNQTVAPVMILSDYFDIRDYGTLSWFSAAYSMSVGTFILPAGRLGDMYGHKRLFILGWIWFAITSLATGFSYAADDILLFSILRGLQGIGPALLVPNAVALLGRNFAVGTPRNTAFAAFGAAGPSGATAGAVFTALIAQVAWWPWSFWALTFVCLFVAGLSVFIVPGEIFPKGGVKTKLSFDWWGAITGVSGLILVNFALNQAPLDRWTTWYIPSLLILGVALLCAFVMIELHFTKDPLIPIRGLGKEAYFALGCIAAGWSSHGIWAYYLYLFLEQVQGHSALLTSAMTSPVAVTGILFALSSVWLVKKMGVATTMLIAMVNFLIGSVLLATVPMNQVYWAQIFLSIIIMPGAMNLSYPSATMLLSNALPKEKQGVAASLVSTMVNYCISCGLGFAGSIHRSFFEKAAKRHGIKMDANHTHHPPLTQRSPRLDRARLDSFRGPWAFMCALSALGVILAAIYLLVTIREAKKKSKRPVIRKVSPTLTNTQGWQGVA